MQIRFERDVAGVSRLTIDIELIVLWSLLQLELAFEVAAVDEVEADHVQCILATGRCARKCDRAHLLSLQHSFEI